MATIAAALPSWHARHAWLLAAAVVGGLAVRVALLPSPGWVGDIDTFVDWTRHIATNGLARAYDENLSFGPVMVYVWWLLGILDPTVATAVDSSDAAVRVVMKLPAVIADVAIAGLAWFALRHRPGLATAAVAVLVLHPALWFVSAWWGTYDSVYTAFGVAAFVLATRGRDALAVVALALAVMTKPQAAPLVVPFAAWYLARAGWRTPAGVSIRRPVLRLAPLAGLGLGTIVVLWLPFLGANGPSNYVFYLARYQGEFYNLLSISAWNLWWPVQEIVAGGKFILDSGPLVGGLSFRVAGYLLTGLFLLVIAVAVARRPSPRALALGLAASALVAYTFLTTMHERYAFAVLPFLALLLDDRRARWVAIVFGLVFVVNNVGASEHYLALLPFHGVGTVVLSFVTVACALLLVVEVMRGSRLPEPPLAINEGSPGAGAGRPFDTSGGSAGATSGA